METGFVHSIQTLGTVDGPGVRFVLFLQGCPLRCSCCHNPDTWEMGAGQPMRVEQITEKLVRYKAYFGKEGGITVSGGEPLVQAAFVTQLFCACKALGIHTCLDTSGCMLPPELGELLSVTDHVLLDIKYTNAAAYRTETHGDYDTVLRFLQLLEEQQIPTWLRQVLITGKNDYAKNYAALAALTKQHTCVKKVEFLPFRNLCEEKYDAMQIPFPLAGVPQTTAAQVQDAYSKLKESPL